MMGNGVIIEIIDVNYNDPFMLVKRLGKELPYSLNMNVVKRDNPKHLGNNASTVRVLLSNNTRGTNV